MNYDEIVDLPAPHARIAERRARLRQLNKDAESNSTNSASAEGTSELPRRALVDRGPVERGSADGGLEQSRVLVGKAEARVVLAIDYGTTFTGIAYAQSTGSRIDLDDIHVVQNWPGASADKVPSEISYSKPKQGVPSFGYSIDPESAVLRKTKLELQDSKDRGRELMTLSKTLHGLSLLKLDDESDISGTIPYHLAKTAEDIVYDYLEHVADVTYTDIVNKIGRIVPEQIPIDIIITHPAGWAEEAINKTYRAATAAFGDRFPTMRNVSFVSEPEACAHYALRAAQKLDHARFRKGDCFVVVDAGGGTVDLASFEIVEMDMVKNRFKIKPVGPISGYACGSTFVDEGFMELLKRRLSPADSEKLIGSGPFGDGGHFFLRKNGMQMYRDFIPIKHSFTGADSGLVSAIQLPPDLDIPDRPDRGIRHGNLELTVSDIRDMFKVPVNRTLTLISAQINALEYATPKHKVKSILLSGGFAKNEYLYSRISEHAGQRNISVEKGDDCWSAVAKGAVLKGLGVLTEMPQYVTRSPCHYGVKTRQLYSSWRNNDDKVETDALGIKWAMDQIKWFVNMGDAIKPDQGHVTTYNCYWLLRTKDFMPSSVLFPVSSLRASVQKKDKGNKRTVQEIVFVASSELDVPSKIGELDLSKARMLLLSCDLTKVPESHRTEYGDKSNKAYKFSVQVEVKITTTEAMVTVTSGTTVIAGPKKMPLLPK